MSTVTDQYLAIEKAWLKIQDAYPSAFDDANGADRNSVIAVRDMARDAWYTALNKVFHESDLLVQELTGDLTSENEAMDDDLAGLKTASKFLDLAKSAAKTAAALAALSA